MESEQVRDAYRSVDHAIGEACEALERLGELEKTLIVLSSDHGMSDTHTHVDAPDALRRTGRNCLQYPILWNRRADCAVMESGNGMAHVYFKETADAWGSRLAYEKLRASGVVGELLALEGIGFVAGEGEDGSVCVETRRGLGVIRCEDGSFDYEFKGDCPLGGVASGRHLTAQDALEATRDARYPDGIVQLWQLFRSERAGDLVLSADVGYDLRARFEYPRHRATHGALAAEQMFVPLATNARLSERLLRTVDVFPTALSLCGRPTEGLATDGVVRT